MGYSILSLHQSSHRVYSRGKIIPQSLMVGWTSFWNEVSYIQSLAKSSFQIPLCFWTFGRLPWLVHGWLLWLVLCMSVVTTDHFADWPLPDHTQDPYPYIPQFVIAFSQHLVVTFKITLMALNAFSGQLHHVTKQGFTPLYYWITISTSKEWQANMASVQFIYTSYVTGSDPYWFQRLCELIVINDQEGMEGTLFRTFSAAYNHWRNLMKLLEVPEDLPTHIRRESIHKNPDLVD